MIIQFILSGGLLLPLVYILLVSKLNMLVRLSMLILFAFGQFLIWFPDRSTTIANFVGVGRGTDLIVYIWIFVSIILILVNVLNMARINSDITILARKLAILEAKQKNDK